MERAAPHVTGWPAEILGFGDRDMPDAAHEYRLALRQTQIYGIHRHAMGLDIRVPDFSTLSSRKRLEPTQVMRQAGSVAIWLDSTGLKIFGQWLAQA